MEIVEEQENINKHFYSVIKIYYDSDLLYKEQAEKIYDNNNPCNF